ncbi:hypothetical protein [Nesterenkonia pannonica]|uniref:hypothetical protein n=1 Tax=Nesterenkonia pannonica TaxID=1548602 RepID=UPI0021649033|nr:hypothetical protein [Nesterenkonia pannonica]
MLLELLAVPDQDAVLTADRNDPSGPAASPWTPGQFSFRSISSPSASRKRAPERSSRVSKREPSSSTTATPWCSPSLS